MYQQLRSEARRQRKALLEWVRLRIDQGETVDFSEMNEQLETLDTVAALRTPWERIIYSVLPVFLAILILLPLWLIRQADPYIQFDAQVTRVGIVPEFSDELDLGKLGRVSLLHVEGLKSLRADNPDIGFENAAGSGSIYLEGISYVTGIDLMSLEDNELDTGNEQTPDLDATVKISQRGQLGALETEHFGVRVRANFDQPVRVISSAAGQTRQLSLTDGIMDMRGPRSENAGVRIYFGLEQDPIDFPVIRPSRLILRDSAFDTSGSRESFSSIEHGSLRLTDIDRTHELLRGTALSLDELEGTLRLTLGPEGLSLNYRGRAKVIELGEDGGAPVRDLRPTLAEYISSDRTIALAWSGLLFIIGLILTVRRTLFG